MHRDARSPIRTDSFILCAAASVWLPFLQGIKFTDNVVADPDLASACTDATLLVFVLPHQFLGRICPQMTTMAKGCRAISLIKGIEFGESGPILISNMIKDAMNGMDVSVLMGANVANEVRPRPV